MGAGREGLIYLYLTKDFGVFRKGTVERFAPPKARALIDAGDAVLYEPGKHAKKPLAPRLSRRRTVTKG